jgi:hypothetical protein
MSELTFQIVFISWTIFVLVIGILLGVWHERTHR